MEPLPLETQTLYAELIEQLTSLEAHRSIGHLSGCFITKGVKGKNYCYFQYSEPGGTLRQIYIGKKDAVLDKVVHRFLQERKRRRADVENIQRLCAQLRVGGALVTDIPSSRILKALAESGVFHLGGVLIGTHAFVVLGNLLGVRWQRAALRTHDVDIALESVLQVAIPPLQADLPQVLENLEMGFFPVPPLNPKHPSTSFKVRGHSLRVDILTPQVARASERPILIRRLNVAATPLRFLDYLIEDYERGAVIGSEAVLVNVPSPARFALHKLLISQERPVVSHAKVEKDLFQASQILAFLSENRPGDITRAWEEIQKRGSQWSRRLLARLTSLKEKYPRESAVISKRLPS